jgi:(+)-pinoresinol hydroxylase
MKRLIAGLLIVASAAAGAAEPSAGKQVFERYCAECHAPGVGHPGTQQLAWTRGKALSVLEARKDLLPAYVAAVVRHGLAEMPPYRPSEINDAALQALVQYLAPAKPATQPKR